MPTYERELVAAARAVARLQTTCRRLRRQLKKAQGELRHEKKMLRGLMSASADRRPDIIPSRLFGDGVGIVPIAVERDERSAASVEALELEAPPKTGTE